MYVLLEPARSADPPKNDGTDSAIALITAPEELRVFAFDPNS